MTSSPTSYNSHRTSHGAAPRAEKAADSAAAQGLWQIHQHPAGVPPRVAQRPRGPARVDTAFRGCTVWFTGLSGAGKTTLSFALEAELVKRGVPAYGLDGDNCRSGLCKDLGFSAQDRAENIRRVGETSKLFADGGIVSLCSFISPFRGDRQLVRDSHTSSTLPFYEVHVATPLSVCETRDVKGLYKKARSGIIKGFTGIDSAYEAPDNADVTVGAAVCAGGEPIEACVAQLVAFLEKQGVLPEESEDRSAAKRRRVAAV